MRVLIGIIIALVLFIGIVFPIGFKHIERLDKEVTAKDTVISGLQSDNDQLNNRIILMQKLNDAYNNTINSVSEDTQKLQNENQIFGNKEVLKKNPTGTATELNNQINSIFVEMYNIGRTSVVKTKKD